VNTAPNPIQNQIIDAKMQRQIQHMVRQAGLKAKLLRQEGFEVMEKGKNDFVTSVDQALDQLLTAQLQQWFPQDGIISEEDARSRQLSKQDYSRFWLIDPIDGTDDFIHGREHYSVMLGLMQDWQPILGWVYAPESDRMFYGGSAMQGIFTCTGESEAVPFIAKTPPILSLESCKVIIGEKDERNYGDRIRAAIPEVEFYGLGSFGLKVMEVISGNAGLYIYLNRRVKLWDTVGPLAIAKATGLTCCDLDGNPIRFDPTAFDPESLAHHQAILIGWAEYIEALRPRLAEAIAK
jgi:3'(2'), 5'-bisphosphate nucleotidase